MYYDINLLQENNESINVTVDKNIIGASNAK